MMSSDVRRMRTGGMAARVRQQLSQCQSDQLLRVASRCQSQVDLEGAAVALQRLARDAAHRETGKDRRLDGLLSIVRESLLRGNSLEKGPMLSLAWSFARLLLAEEPLMDELSCRSVVCCSDFSCSEVASSMWAFAKLEVRNHLFMDASSSRASHMVREFSTAQVANVSWSLAKLHMVESPLLDAIADRASEHLPDFPSQDLCSLAWAMAKLHHEDVPLMVAVSDHAVTMVCEMSPVDITSVSWALARCEVPCSHLAYAVSEALEHRLSTLTFRQLSMWLWAFAKVYLESPALVEAISALVVSNLRDLDCHDLVGLLRSLSRQALDANLVHELCEECERRMDSFTGPQLASVAASVARMQGSPEERTSFPLLEIG